jgi:hypothetical protein
LTTPRTARSFGRDRGQGSSDESIEFPGGPGRPPGRHGRPSFRPGRFRFRRRRPRKVRSRRWRRIRRAILAAVAIFVLLVGWSVGRALVAPGGGTLSDRLAEWARDHYLGPVVTLGEWLTYQPPRVGGKPSFALTGQPSAAPGRTTARKNAQPQGLAPHRLQSLAGKALPGEGVWRVLASVNGKPAIYGTYLRASSVYTSYVAGLAWINQDLVKFQLRPGTEDPGPGNWHAQPYIPPGTRRGLLATFNNGFRIASSDGGFYLNGDTSGTLTPGVASEVYYRDGRLGIGVWNRTVRMGPDVVGVRQNLHLIVVHGRVPSTVDQNVESSWGATLGGGYYVWRSGIGITRGGQIVFAYGPALDVREIAELLRRAGVVTGMELDINPAWMSFMYYLPHDHPGNPTPVDLLPGQSQPPDRYYYVNSRDFTAVYAR